VKVLGRVILRRQHFHRVFLQRLGEGAISCGVLFGGLSSFSGVSELMRLMTLITGLLTLKLYSRLRVPRGKCMQNLVFCDLPFSAQTDGQKRCELLTV